MDAKIKIVLAEDKPLMRMGLAALLRDYSIFEMVGEAANGKELLELLKTIKADVVILDIEMPVMNGIEALKVIRARFPDIKVIILSVHNDNWNIKNAIVNGAHAYLSKDCLPESLVKAITTVHNEGFYLEEYVLKALMQSSFYGPEKGNYTPELSSREKEILKELCEGKSEKEIAQKLNISPHTVHFHRRNLHLKTKSHNLAGLLKYASKNDLISRI